MQNKENAKLHFTVQEYIRIRKRTFFKWVAIVVAIATLLVFGLLLFSGQKSRPAPVRTELSSYMELRADNKTLFFFDSMIGDSLFANAALSPSAIHFAGQLPPKDANLRGALRRYRAHVAKMLAELSEQEADMDYYLSVHDVYDEGFTMVAAYTSKLHDKVKLYKAILNRIDSMPPHSAIAVVRHSTSSYNPSHAAMPITVAYSGMARGNILKGRWSKAAGAYRRIMIYPSETVCATRVSDSIITGRRIDSTGIYTGQLSQTLQASGHGTLVSGPLASGSKAYSFFEGKWSNGKKNGFGMLIGGNGMKVGEWENNKYKGERMTYNSERIYGIDISRHQHQKGRKLYSIHWNKLRITHLGRISNKKIAGRVDYPVTFIYIKCTEGTTIKNRFYAGDIRQARRHGIVCGSYHFFSTRTSGAAQARHFLKHANIRPGDLPPVLDVEPSEKQIRNMGGIASVIKHVKDWTGIVKRHTGTSPILYVSQSFIKKHLSHIPEIKKEYNVWIARYGEYRPDLKLMFWQLSPDGRVDGIHGDVDINVFNGYSNSFEKLKIKN